jgi:3-deoxy-manno-octulosonate cytidylyltransferase (CMP-KDO synthetase)
MIEASIQPFQMDTDLQCVNLTQKIETEEEFRDPNTIKVVMDRNQDALYFSREPIPTHRIIPFDKFSAYKQICIIPFRREILLKYARLEPTPLEIAESIDMMRLIEHGFKVRMVETFERTHSVDTPEDLYRVAALMRDDPLVRRCMA